MHCDGQVQLPLYDRVPMSKNAEVKLVYSKIHTDHDRENLKSFHASVVFFHKAAYRVSELVSNQWLAFNHLTLTI